MKVALQELRSHNSKDDLWIAVEGKVYNVTKFQGKHPGGKSILNKVAGTDATKKFLKFHPPSVLRMLQASEVVGELDNTALEDRKQPAAEARAKETTNQNTRDGDVQNGSTHNGHGKVVDVRNDVSALDDSEDAEARQLELNRRNKPSLGEIYNLFDFEGIARQTLDRTGWYYYSSGSDDEMTLRENHNAFQRIWFRPRILVDVAEVNYSTTLLGKFSRSPFYITATALAKLGHPDGETVMTKAAAKTGIIQMLSTFSSCTIDEVVKAATPTQVLWMQVYVTADRAVTRDFIKHAESLGVEGFFVTVDAPQLGRREKDMRSKYDADLDDVEGIEEEEEEAAQNKGVARAISGYIDPKLSWKDIPFLRECTTKPIVLKGVQRWEDAVLAAQHGLDGIVLSNHGGRQLEFSRSGIEVLAEVMYELRARKLESKIEVFMDGGVRRGTDVLKALCLGAKGVGIGRPFLYAMSTYGVPGVVKAIQLLNDEIEMNMRLLGVTDISQLRPDMVDIKALGAHNTVPTDYSSTQVYEHLLQPQFKHKL